MLVLRLSHAVIPIVPATSLRFDLALAAAATLDVEVKVPLSLCVVVPARVVLASAGVLCVRLLRTLACGDAHPFRGIGHSRTRPRTVEFPMSTPRRALQAYCMRHISYQVAAAPAGYAGDLPALPPIGALRPGRRLVAIWTVSRGPCS